MGSIDLRRFDVGFDGFAQRVADYLFDYNLQEHKMKN